MKDLEHFKALESAEKNRFKTKHEMIKLMEEELQEFNETLEEHERNRQE